MKMKRTQPPETDFMEGFGQWLESEEGLQSQEAVDCVYDALDGASVDIAEKKIIWSDGQQLTIEQSAERIHRETNLCQDTIIGSFSFQVQGSRGFPIAFHSARLFL